MVVHNNNIRNLPQNSPSAHNATHFYAEHGMYQYVKPAFFSHLEDVLALDEVDADPVLGEDVPLLVDAHQHRLRRLQRDQLREGVRCLGLRKQELGRE